MNLYSHAYHNRRDVNARSGSGRKTVCPDSEDTVAVREKEQRVFEMLNRIKTEEGTAFRIK